MRYYAIRYDDETGFDEEFVDVEFIKNDENMIDVEFKFDTVITHLDEFNWENFGKMIFEVELWKEELCYVADFCKDHNIKCWTIKVHDDVVFNCDGDGPCTDLGRLAECYDDCEECDRYCFNSESNIGFDEIEQNCHRTYMCPHYEENGVFGSCLCTRVNGRKMLEKAIKGE
jgi:hypothetical protein